MLPSASKEISYSYAHAGFLLLKGHEIVPLNPDGSINHQYAYEKIISPTTYRINNVEQLDRYFNLFKCDVGYILDNRINHVEFSENETFFYFFTVKQRGRYEPSI